MRAVLIALIALLAIIDAVGGLDAYTFEEHAILPDAEIQSDIRSLIAAITVQE